MQTLFSKYRKNLNHGEQVPFYGLYEGMTPLVRSHHIAGELGENVNLFFKLESRNPSFSFKDRGVSNVISQARLAGKIGVICSTSGNLGVSCAMYAARARMKSVILIPKLFVNEEKIKRMQLHDAAIFVLDGDIFDGIKIGEEFAAKYNFELVSYNNQYYQQGLKTISFEVCDELGRVPDIFSCGIGHGTLMGSVWRGFKEYYSSSMAERLPVMMGFEACSSSSTKVSISKGYYHRSTILNEVSLGSKEILDDAVIARDESSGYISSVTDEQTLAVYQTLARKESIIADVSSCISVAGLYKLKADGVDFDNQTIVCVLSGTSDSSEILYVDLHGVSRLKVIKPFLSDLESELII